MLIRKFGIELRRITVEDIETIRTWRNKDFVRNNMNYTQVISANQQRQWFYGLDNRSNFYFIIRYMNDEIGLINLKDVDWQTKEAEAGIFIGLEAYLATITPILATITLMDFAFDILQLKSLKAKVNKNNPAAIRFNQSLGYTFRDYIDDTFTYYTCSTDQFKRTIQPLRATANKLTSQLPEIKMEKEEILNPELGEKNLGGFKLTIL